MSLFTKPNATQFFYISLMYALISPIVGVYLAHPVIAFLAFIMLSGFAITVNRYRKPPLPDKFFNVVRVMWVPFLLWSLVSGEALVYASLSVNKSELQQTTGIVPAKPTIIRGNKTTKYYFEINNQPFHCQYNTSDTCKEAYKYAGQKINIFYYPTRWTDNVIYEMTTLDGKTVYNFSEQLSSFQKEQTVKRQQWAWVFILFVLTWGWFYYHDKRLYQQISSMSEEERQHYLRLQQPTAQRIQTESRTLTVIFRSLAILLASATAIAFCTNNFFVGMSLMIMSSIMFLCAAKV